MSRGCEAENNTSKSATAFELSHFNRCGLSHLD